MASEVIARWGLQVCTYLCVGLGHGIRGDSQVRAGGGVGVEMLGGHGRGLHTTHTHTYRLIRPAWGASWVHKLRQHRDRAHTGPVRHTCMSQPHTGHIWISMSNKPLVCQTNQVQCIKSPVCRINSCQCQPNHNQCVRQTTSVSDKPWPVSDKPLVCQTTISVSVKSQGSRLTIFAD